MKRIILIILLTFCMASILWLFLTLAIPFENNLFLQMQADYSSLIFKRSELGAFILATIYLVVSTCNETIDNSSNKSIIDISYSLRLSLLVFIFLFFYYGIQYLWFFNAGYVFGMDFIFGLWPILLFIDFVITIYVILFDPYIRLLNPFFNIHENQSRKRVTLNAVTRVIILVVIFQLIRLFQSASFPIDGGKLLISTAFFAIIGIIPIILNKAFKRDL